MVNDFQRIEEIKLIHWALIDIILHTLCNLNINSLTTWQYAKVSMKLKMSLQFSEGIIYPIQTWIHWTCSLNVLHMFVMFSASENTLTL